MTSTIHIPVDFILANARLTWGDVRHGLEKRFIEPEDAICIAIAQLLKKEEGSPIELQLAGLLPNETNRVPELIASLTEESNSENNASFKWLYLALAWVYAKHESLDDPLGIVEQIYSDFDYPADVAPFVRYMPPSDGYRPQDHSKDENYNRLFRLWQEYLLKHPLNISR
jgi:hypothetical protein